MKPSSPHRPTPLAFLAVLIACGTDSLELPSEIATGVVADRIVSNDAPRFSAWSAPLNVGTPVNTAFAEQEPFITKDGLSLYFQCLNCLGGLGGQDIWVSQRASEDDPWGPPVNVGPPINSEFNDFPSAVSVDGHKLYMNSNRPGGFGGLDLYVARRRDKRDNFAWQAPVNLGSGVNTTADEFQAVPIEDDVTGAITIYFTSNRSGGLGAADIYTSTLQPDGTFGPAVLVAELSSPSVDQQPAIRRDGLEMVLASNRAGTFGGLDLWVSTRESISDSWSTPINLGSVVNGTGIDAAPALSFDGTALYFSSARPGNVGGGTVFDLWVTTRSKLKGPD